MERCERKDVPCDADGHGQQRQLRPPPFAQYPEDAVEHRRPHQGDGKDLGAQGYGAVFAEVADVLAETAVRQEPRVKPRRRTHPEGRRQQQERRGGQQRQEDADDAQRKGDAPEYGEEDFHDAKIA